jgi:L-threonylcarbamoyladenylate synthase
VKEAFERCIAEGGVALFPADTVYGLACDPEDADAVRRLYALKGRPAEKPAAVMFFDLTAALAAIGPVGRRTVELLEGHLPGAFTFLLPNPGGLFPLACGPDPGTLGIRVPDVSLLSGAGVAVLQTSANLSGRAEAKRLEEVPQEIRDGADLVIDGGRLLGTASTVVDLRQYERTGQWRVARQGAGHLLAGG